MPGACCVVTDGASGFLSWLERIPRAEARPLAMEEESSRLWARGGTKTVELCLTRRGCAFRITSFFVALLSGIGDGGSAIDSGVSTMGVNTGAAGALLSWSSRKVDN